MTRSRPHRSFAMATATAALVLSSIAATGSPAAAQPTPGDIDPEDVLSHFLCYRGKMKGFPDAADRPTIAYSDFFDERNAQVGAGRAFCNPVQKQKGRKVLAQITSRRHHLKLYDLVQEPFIVPVIDVIVFNQFGMASVGIVKWPTSLAVPTRKAGHRFPNRLDHFACHRILPEDELGLQFKLRDQFGTHKRMKVGRAIELCAPADKRHDGRTFHARNPGAYLTCYEVSSRQMRPKQKRRTWNQFERRRNIVAKRTHSLCVPSTVATVR